MHHPLSISPHFTSAVGQLPLVKGESGLCLASVNPDVKTITLSLEALSKEVNVVDQDPCVALTR